MNRKSIDFCYVRISKHMELLLSYSVLSKKKLSGLEKAERFNNSAERRALIGCALGRRERGAELFWNARILQAGIQQWWLGLE